MNGTEYIIIGDTDRFNDCLVCLAGRTKEEAEEVLNRMINNPTDNDKKTMEGHRNFRIKEVDSKTAWWNDPFLAN